MPSHLVANTGVITETHFLNGGKRIVFVGKIVLIVVIAAICIGRSLAISGDAAALAQSAKPYNLTPMYALTEIKDSPGTRYFCFWRQALAFG